MIDTLKESDSRPILVSIRCCTYNHEPYIRQCLEGFVMQKTNFRFEAIVHDDASTDGTANIIREYAEKYPDIIKPIFETENQYSKRDGSLRRIMNAHMFGKYVAMCEGDDYWIDPLKLQKQVDYLEQNLDFSMCFHNAIVFNQSRIKKRRIETFNFFKNDCVVNIGAILQDWFIPTASIVYRKSLLKEYPRFFSGDYTLSLVLAFAGKIYYMDAYMSVYRLNDSGVSVNFKRDKWCEQMMALLDWFNGFTNRCYSDEILKRKKEIIRNVRYNRLKDKNMILPLLLMPCYTFRMFKGKIAKMSDAL